MNDANLPNIVPEEQLPSYQMAVGGQHLRQSTAVRDDGRIDVDLNSRLCKTLSRLIPDAKTAAQPQEAEPPAYYDSFPVRLNIVIQVVGSRGDVQPFIALGNELQRHGHRIRLATHNVFDAFVRDAGLEFFPIGGDPSELMAYMVKNPGLIPSLKSLRAGDIQRKRGMVVEMLDGCWRSCLEPDPVSGKPFVADAIIANPPSFAHVHCAQAMGIPVHLMFTMPWTSTRAFSHPLANLKFGGKAGIDPQTANHLSFSVVEWLTWQGLGDVINDWRKTLELEPVPMSEGPLLAETLKIPFTYCWSPALVGKPVDWPSWIDVCGFFFREPPQYTPPPDLAAFLKKGGPPVYIGFGSIVIEDPEAMTHTLVEAVRRTGVRAIISKGWSKLGGIDDKNILFLGDCPHEWLFSRVSCVIHHGGAGTTACGLLNGRPTTIVPFFGDQPFWGGMVAASGAGPRPIPQREINVDNVSDAIWFCLTPGASTAAAELAAKMRTENGVETAVRSFHANLPVQEMRCDIMHGQTAVWVCKRGKKRIQLSKMAAAVLGEHLKMDQKKLDVNISRRIEIINRRWDPISGTASSLMGTGTDMAKATSSIVMRPIQTYQQRSKSPAHRVAAEPDSKSTDPLHHACHDLQQLSTYKPPQTARGGGPGTTGAVMAASASGVGDFFKSFGKGFYIDMPLAFAEGCRAVPRMYGEEVPEHEPIRDWQSGARVAGKNFVEGVSDGFAGLVMQPIKGGKEGGAVGAAKGVGKGLVGLTTKTASAALGIVAYPSHGIYQSIRGLVKSHTRHQIMDARWQEGSYLIRNSGDVVVDVPFVLSRFATLTQR